MRGGEAPCRREDERADPHAPSPPALHPGFIAELMIARTMTATAIPTDPYLRDAIALMQDINERLLASRLQGVRLTWRAGRARVDGRVLDGGVCAVQAAADRAP